MRKCSVGLGAVAALTLVGCATTYQQSGFTGGYSDQKINESAYVVSFSGNGFASRERIWYFWMYRCAQLTRQSGYQLFAIRPLQKSAGAFRGEAAVRPAAYRPGRHGRLVRTAYVAVPIIVPGGGSPKWTYSATVLMFHTPLPQGVPWAIDAREVMQELDAYVSSNGKAPAPSTTEVVAQAFTAHATIGLGAGLRLEPRPPGGSPSPAASPAPGLRSPSEIREALDGSRLVAIYQAYENYTLRVGSSPSGTIHLAFEISPNGIVRNCRVVSSTFSDSAFVNTIRYLVGTAGFGARDVLATEIADFPITFAPR